MVSLAFTLSLYGGYHRNAHYDFDFPPEYLIKPILKLCTANITAYSFSERGGNQFSLWVS
jgi:hypothetical protein